VAVTFTQRLDLRQTQALVMTPQLQQAIKLLQLSNLELSEMVAQELQQNPLLEEDNQADLDKPMPGAEAGQDRVEIAVTEGPVTIDDQAADIDLGAITEPAADIFDGAQTLDESAGGQSIGNTGGTPYDGDFSDLSQHMSDEPTLREHLSAQLNTAFTDPGKKLIGAALIEATESTGYLSEGSETPKLVAANLGIDMGQVEDVLSTMQQFTPVGIMARNLSECLALQLRDRDRFDPAMALLCQHLDLLGARRFNDLERICGVDSADLRDMIAEIRALDPKPGEQFGGAAAQTIVPDILMRPSQAGNWIIELNSDTLPRVLINQKYYVELKRACRTVEDRDYLTQKLTTANWLIRSLDQRANTILKVATEIVKQQDQFFYKGVSALQPLTLRNIAELIGMHESTVSRVTTNKYMSTPRGMFELKYFFSVAIQSSDGEAPHASKAIQHRLRTLIAAESPEVILSDDTLVEQLQSEGIDIARRTVAKYREQMGIPSSVQRRRQKSLAGPAAR
jgi:RNA polymerase sigma-54 factor